MLRGVARIMHFVVVYFHIIVFPYIRTQISGYISEEVVLAFPVSTGIV